MATTTGLSPAQVQNLIQTALLNHERSLVVLQQIYRWSSGITQSDMETAAGVSAADALTYLSAPRGRQRRSQYALHRPAWWCLPRASIELRLRSHPEPGDRAADIACEAGSQVDCA